MKCLYSLHPQIYASLQFNQYNLPPTAGIVYTESQFPHTLEQLILKALECVGEYRATVCLPVIGSFETVLGGAHTYHNAGAGSFLDACGFKPAQTLTSFTALLL